MGRSVFVDVQMGMFCWDESCRYFCRDILCKVHEQDVFQGNEYVICIEARLTFGEDIEAPSLTLAR